MTLCNLLKFQEQNPTIRTHIPVKPDRLNNEITEDSVVLSQIVRKWKNHVTFWFGAI